jgi:hypothetical protein
MGCAAKGSRTAGFIRSLLLLLDVRFASTGAPTLLPGVVDGLGHRPSLPSRDLDQHRAALDQHRAALEEALHVVFET